MVTTMVVKFKLHYVVSVMATMLGRGTSSITIQQSENGMNAFPSFEGIYNGKHYKLAKVARFQQ